MNIEQIETAYYRLPLEPMGDAGHGAIDSEELITLTLHAEGLVGHGYSYTIGRGGRAVQALIEHDLAPLLLGHDASDIQGLWQLMWQRLLYVGRGGLAAFAIAAVDIALWDLYGLREQKPLYALCGGQARAIPAYGSGVDLPKPLDALLAQIEGFVARGFPGVKVKVGRSDPREDEARVAAVRASVVGYRGTLAVAALAGERVVFMKFDGSGGLKWTKTPATLRRIGRLRSVTVAPNNDLLITTADGSRDRVLRVRPAR